MQELEPYIRYLGPSRHVPEMGISDGGPGTVLTMCFPSITLQIKVDIGEVDARWWAVVLATEEDRKLQRAQLLFSHATSLLSVAAHGRG